MEDITRLHTSKLLHRRSTNLGTELFTRDYSAKGYVGGHTDKLSDMPPIKVNNDSNFTVRKDYSFTIGTVKLSITDPYGIRTMEGRENEHSTGIDYVTSNKKAIAITDMEIIDVKLQGDGNVIKPEKGNGAAGYYIVAKNSDGTYSQYMHLDPMTSDEMSELKGKKFKRGDSIWGYGIGSGSMTGPHVKYRVADGIPSSSNNFDPSKYILGAV